MPPDTLTAATTETTPRPHLPPGPLRLPLVGRVVDKLFAGAYVIGADALAEEVMRRSGGAMTAHIPGFGTTVLVTDPALVKQVFTAKPDVLLGGAGVGPAGAIYGSGSMFVQEEPEHLRRRRMLTPPLHGKALASYEPVIAARTKQALDRLSAGERFRFLPWVHDVALEVIVEVIFGPAADEELPRLGAPFKVLLNLANSEELVVRYAMRRTGALRHWPARTRVHAAIDEVGYPLIDRRRTDGDVDSRSDILSLLVAARGEHGERLTDREVRDDLITLVLAGHETTSTTLAWAMDLLLHHQSSLTRVTEEASSGETAYTEAVLNETLRLRPPVPVTGRVTAEYFELGEWTLPPGTRVVPYIPLVNRNPQVYDDPDAFRPERFLDSRPETYAWIPFGGGLKRCVGAAFSMREMTTMLHTILAAGTLRAAGRGPARPSRGAAVIVPHHGVPVTWHPNGRMPRVPDGIATN